VEKCRMKEHIDLLEALARRMEAYYNNQRDDLWGRNEAGFLAKELRKDIAELEEPFEHDRLGGEE